MYDYGAHQYTTVSKFSTDFTVELFHPTSDQHPVEWVQYSCELICYDDRHTEHHSNSSNPRHGYDTALEFTAYGLWNMLYNSLLLQNCSYGSIVQTKDSCHLGCDTVLLGKYFPIYWRTVAPSSSGPSHPRWSDPEDTSTVFLWDINEMHHNPDNLNLQKHCW